MKKKPEIKSCPFCGNKPQIVPYSILDSYRNENGYQVLCEYEDCKVSVFTRENRLETDAVKAWNTRNE